MFYLVPKPRKQDREGANAVVGTKAFPTPSWLVYSHLPYFTYHNVSP